MKQLTLTHKTLIAVFIILLPLFITFTYSYKTNKEHLKEKVLDEMAIIAEAYEGQVYLFIEMSKRRARDFGSDGFIRERLMEIEAGSKGAAAALSRHLLKNKITLDKNINAIDVLSLDGIVVASTDTDFPGKSRSPDEFFSNGLSGISVTEKSYTEGGDPELLIAAPVIDPDSGRPLGVIANHILLSELNRLMIGEFISEIGDIVGENKRHQTMEVYLVNRDRLMITESIFVKDTILKGRVDTPPVAACLDSGKEIVGFYNDYRGVEVAGASKCLEGLGWVLLVENNVKGVISPSNVLLKTALGAAVVVAFLIGGLFVLFLRTVVRPLGEVTSAAKAIAAGDYDVAVPVKSSDEIGTLSSMFNSMARDIKDRAKALAESEERLRAVIDNSTAVIYVKDLDGRFTLVNRWYAKVFNKEREEIGGKTDHDLFPVDVAEKFRENDLKVLESGTPMEFEEVAMQSDGPHIYLSIKFPLFDSSGKPYAICGISTDITERKRVEEELFKAQKLESVGLLAGGIAHDFNNLLTAILGNISVARTMLAPEERAAEKLQEAEKALLRAVDLTKQLLTFSKGGAPVKETLFLGEILREICDFAASGSKVRCEYSISDDLLHVDVDEGQINQVINNLIINAIHAMPEGGIINIRVSNCTFFRDAPLPLEKGRYVKIEIDDHGTGIPEENLAKVFDPYFTTKENGSGLGLASVYSIIKKHDGYIDVDSEEGKGTTFTIYLPASDKTATTRDKKELELASAGSGRVLVMDDDELVRDVAGDILSTLGYEVGYACDGEEALEIYKRSMAEEKPFDVVLMDLTIRGGMGGREAIKEFVKIDPGVKAIVSSGYSNDEIMSGFSEYGFSGVVIKPYRAKDLGKAIQKVLKGDSNETY